MKNRRNFAVTVLGLLGCIASAQADVVPPAQKYAVISLIGEELGLIGFQPTLGSRLDRNLRSSATIAGAGFDATALRTIQESTKGFDDKAVVVLYGIKSPRLSADPSSLFALDKVVLPPSFAEVIKEDGASYLLLLTRKRNEARLQTMNTSVGAGTVQGVGYFADGQASMINHATNFSSIGFLAPYVSLQLSLVEVASGKIVGRRNVYDARVLSDDGKPPTSTPWAIVPDTQKIPYLNSLIEENLKKALPALLRGDDPIAPGTHNF